MYINHINKTFLPGKLKLWCLHFGILPRLIWPLTVYEILSQQSGKAKKKVSETVWNSGLDYTGAIVLWDYENGKLELSITTSLVEEFKWTKARLAMTLTDSEDIAIWTAAPCVSVRRKNGLHLKPCTIQSQHFISGTWLVKSNMGEQALGSSQKLLNVIRQHQGRRDGSLWKRWRGRRMQSGKLRPSHWPSRVNGLNGWI